jgi:Lectin C-type domain
MQGLLAAALALALALALTAGCSFNAPKGGDGNGGGPDAGGPAGTDAGPTPDAPPARCTMTYDFSYGGHKYRLIDSGMSWAQAKAACETDGGYLLKIETSEEDRKAEEAFAFGPAEVWMGLRDPSNDGVYVWTDGTAPSFSRWSASPSAGSPDCVVKNTYTTDGGWYTRNCTDSKAVICECGP